MSLEIPTSPDPYYSLRTRLDGSDYTLEFLYSTRQERLYLNLFDSEERLLVAGLKLLTGVALLLYLHHLPGIPPGELMIVATGADDSPPKLTELGQDKRCSLVYFTAEETRALQGA